jgi:hypothetical protein
MRTLSAKDRLKSEVFPKFSPCTDLSVRRKTGHWLIGISLADAGFTAAPAPFTEATRTTASI